MVNFLFKTPEGFNDMLNLECQTKIQVENNTRSIFSSHGYMEVDTPTLEYYDLFRGDIDAVPQERMFKLIDNKGRILSLRPDITVPVMRLAITKLGNKKMPLKLSYFGNVFRNDIKNFINCEYRQAGIEILGSNTIYADAEVIAIAVKSLLQNNINDFRIDIGQVKLFKALTQDIEDEEKLEEIRQAISNKDRYGIERALGEVLITERKKTLLSKLPYLFGSIQVIKDVEEDLYEADEISALKELTELIEILKQWGFEKYISIDLGMVQSLNYYSGIIFRGYAVDCGFSICWGGRYDNLSKNFNENISATGCALGINRIVEVLERNQKAHVTNPADFFIISSENRLDSKVFNISERLRQNGFIVEDSLFKDINKAADYCRVKGIKRLIILIDCENIKAIEIDTGKAEICNVDILLGGGIV